MLDTITGEDNHQNMQSARFRTIQFTIQIIQSCGVTFCDLTSFCRQYSTSVQQFSSFTTSAGHPGLGTMADMDDVTTTRPTPLSLAARSTLSVPFTAGSSNSLCPKRKRNKQINQEGFEWLRQGTGWGDLKVRRGIDLGILDAVDGAGRGEVKDTGGAPDRSEEGGRVEEVDFEEVESLGGAIEGSKVRRLSLVP
ncbi:hypothetical protein BHM03_00009914 [Ensete ventricosum]|nr:hypothetical protein BHM03_00009914 [Ensete ventricosum]